MVFAMRAPVESISLLSFLCYEVAQYGEVGTSEAFLAEISVWSHRLFMFIIKKCAQDQSIRTTLDLILEKASLDSVPGLCGWF